MRKAAQLNPVSPRKKAGGVERPETYGIRCASPRGKSAPPTPVER